MAAAWSATAGRSSLVGLAVVADRCRRGRWRGCRRRWSPTPPCWRRWPTDARCARTRPSPSCERWRLMVPTFPRCSSTRPSPPTCSTRPRPAMASATCWSATPATGCRMPAPRPASWTSPRRPTDEAQVAANEALAVSRLAPAVIAALEAQGMASLYAEIENPLVRVLARMEDVGIAVDRAELDSLNTRLTAETRRLGQQVRDVVGRDFNINSPIQLRQILYEERGLSSTKRTKTGLSTDAATLEKLRDEWPEFIEPLLQYREAEKLRSTYGEGLLAEVAPDGRIHATFNQTVARTGRLSSDQPNLHNIPVRSEEGRQFRRAFVPAAGCTLPGGRLQPDRAALHRPPGRGSRLDRGLHRRGGHPHRHRVAGVRRRARATSPSACGPRPRWSATGWPTAWRPTGWASASTSRPRTRRSSSTPTSTPSPT